MPALALLILAANPHLPAGEMAAHLTKIEQAGGPPASVMYGLICVETGDTWKTTTRGAAGEWGLTQVHPCHKKLHAQAHTGWVGQMDAGASILRDCMRRHPKSMRAALADYNGGPSGHRKARCLRYADRTLAKGAKAK